MNIDERLEAFTHSVELLAGMHRDSERANARQMKRMRRRINDLLTVTSQLVTATNQLVTVTNQDAENIRALARIAEDHRERIEKLEGDR